MIKHYRLASSIMLCTLLLPAAALAGTGYASPDYTSAPAATATGAATVGTTSSGATAAAPTTGAPGGVVPKFTQLLSTRLTVEEEYTDNIEFATATGKGFITTVRPGFSLSAGSPRAGIKADYDFGFSQYWKISDHFLEHALTGSVWKDWEHWRFDTAGTFSRQEFPIETVVTTGAIVGLRSVISPYYRAAATPGLSYIFGEERSIRVGYYYDAYWNNDNRFQNSRTGTPNATITYGLDKFNVVTLGYEYEQVRFSQVRFSEASDFDAKRAQASFTHRLTPHMDLTAAYAYGNVDFTVGQGYQSHQGTLSTNISLAENLKASLAGGYYRIKQGELTTSGPVVNGSLTRTFPKGAFVASGEWGFGEDYVSSENLGVYKYWNSHVGVTYQLLERLGSDISANYGRTDYQAGRNDDYWTTTAGLSWIIQPWLSARASYAHANYVTHASPSFVGRLWNLDTNEYILGLTATYDRPL